ncbi:unnamed protein product [marine sediment metagenome]|uniref:Uncharacterized protein n=1 Tax=marine sediment metagenome TaxID=412755 RepID=X0WIP6_9ZZZZ
MLIIEGDGHARHMEFPIPRDRSFTKATILSQVSSRKLIFLATSFLAPCVLIHDLAIKEVAHFEVQG